MESIGTKEVERTVQPKYESIVGYIDRTLDYLCKDRVNVNVLYDLWDKKREVSKSYFRMVARKYYETSEIAGVLYITRGASNGGL